MGAPAQVGHRGAGLSNQQFWLQGREDRVVIAGSTGILGPESILLPVAGFEWFRVIAGAFSCTADPLVVVNSMAQLFLNFYDNQDNFIDFLVLASITPFLAQASGTAVAITQPLERINLQASVFPAGVAKFSISGALGLSNPTAGDLNAVGIVRGLAEVL